MSLDFDRLHPFFLPCSAITVVAVIITWSEVLRWSAIHCGLTERVRRMAWAWNFHRASPIILALLALHQAERVEELQEMVGVDHKIPVATMMAAEGQARVCDPGTIVITRDADGRMEIDYTLRETVRPTAWVSR